LGDDPRVPRFVFQLHRATSLHFDFRLEVGRVAKSWAVPKGPSLDPSVKRLAVPVEDHPRWSLEFEGHYGPRFGTAIVWDAGAYEHLGDGAIKRALADGHATFRLDGEKVAGGFALTRWDDRKWLLVKMDDEHADPGFDVVAARPESVVSGLTLEELEARED
jgi:DNA ligase D-like protein (predicted 3'-phosphoesterase)